MGALTEKWNIEGIEIWMVHNWVKNIGFLSVLHIIGLSRVLGVCMTLVESY